MNSTFEIYFNLTGCALISVVMSAVFYLLKRKTAFGKINYIAQQIIIGIFFGIVAILGTQYGVDVGGATANARDAAPLCAGLLFGGPSGIIAGVIGGAWRYIAVRWGAGAYSQIACSISTALAGVYAAFLRKFVFGSKRPTLPLAFVTGAVMEIIHFTILFITHLTDPETAFGIVKIVTFPMVICNGCSVMLSVLAVMLLSSGIHKKETRYKSISQRIQTPMLIAVAVAFLISTTFVYYLQTYSAQESAVNVMKLNIEDAKNDIFVSVSHKKIADITLINDITKSRHIGESGHIVVADGEFNIVSNISSLDENMANCDALKINENTELDTAIKTSYGGEKFIYYVSEANGYYIIAIMPLSEVYSTRDATVYMNSYIEILVYALLFILIALITKRHIVNNIHSINRTLGRIIRGDLNGKVDEFKIDEFANLSDDINSTVGALKQYIEEAETRMDKELELAKSIQHSVLPSVFSPFPDKKQFDIYATMETAKEVGGDFYDFFMPDEKHIAIIIADVSGKGIPAAMFMMTAKTTIKNLTQTGLPINDVFTVANEKLCEGNDSGMFVTAWAGVVDIETGHVEFANAGHNPPLICRSGKFEYLKSKAGFVLAGMEGVKYKMQEFDLQPGDRIYLYTDGVTEATNPDNCLYGEERLQNYLNANKQFGAEEMLLNVKKDIDVFAGEAEQFDDITMLMFDYVGTKVPSDMITKEYPADESSFEKAMEFITECLENEDASPKSVMQISVAFEELFVNVLHYAYPDNPGNVTVGFKAEDRYATIEIKDSGIPFNPFDKEDPDITLSAEERNIGGLGIFMTKKIMDEFSYEYRDGCNIVRIGKAI